MQNKTIANGHTNPAFSGDNDQGFVPSTTIELHGKTKPTLDTEYNPYEHRKVEHPTTNNETLIHLLKGALGTGILAVPAAFNHSGWLLGLFGTIIVGIVCTHCVHILIESGHQLCKRNKVPSLNYASLAEKALLEGPDIFKPFAPKFVHVINGFLIVYLLGSCAVYVIFVSSNIKAVADYYMELKIDVRLYMVMILIPLILINWVRNLKFLAPFSTIANAITIASFGVIAYYIFRSPISFEEREAVGPITEFPLFFGTVLFALEAIYVMLPLENEMKNPENFGGHFGVLNKAMILIVSLYIAMGFFGYLKYGPEILGSITLNLAPSEALAQSVKAMIALAIFINHGLACYVVFDTVWNDYLKEKIGGSTRTTIYEYVLRTILVIVTCLLAIAIPNLELFISLVGTMCLSAIGVAFPALIQTCTYWHQKKGAEKTWMIFKNSLIGIVAIMGLIVGTYTSISDIIVTYF